MHALPHRLTVFHARAAEKTIMTDLDYALPTKTGDLAVLKARVAGLMIACPVTQDNPFDCPLKSVRMLPLHERYRWLGTLHPDQVRGCLDQHGACILRKEQETHEPA
jgi:hypothetical protein